MKFNLASVLNLLPVVGPAIAAAPAFKTIYDGLVATFDSDSDQETLKTAYDFAISDAHNARTELADLVRRNS